MRLLVALLVLAPAQDASVLRLSWGVPGHLDPHRASTVAESRYVLALFEGLTGAGEDGVSVVPGLAEGWEATPDGLTWTFRLREAVWSNGEPVTAGDVVFAWRRACRLTTGCPFLALFRPFRNVGAWLEAQEADAILDQYAELKGAQPALVTERLAATARRRHGEALRRRGEEAAAKAAERRMDVDERDLGFEAADARTLRVTLERPTPWLPHLVSLHPFVPLHEKALAAGQGWVKPANIVTNGPYLFEEATPARIVLRRNPRYWDPVLAAAPARIDAGLHSPEVALSKYRDGALDWIAREQVPDAEARKVEGRVRFDAWGVYFLRPNARRAPFDRPGARLAFARAVDRAPLAEAADASPAAALVPAGYPGWRGSTAPAFDKAAAMEGLLKEAAFDLSTLPELELLAPDVLGLGATAEALKAQLEKTLGVRVRLQAMKLPAFMRAQAAGEFHLALGAWLGDAFDPSTYLEGWVQGHPQNAGRWSHAEFDALIEAAAADREPAARLEKLAKAEGVLLGDGGAIPLYGASDFYAATPKVRGLKPNPLGRFPLKFVRLKG
jgi:oligopeptide transport system substrate-binding protein